MVIYMFIALMVVLLAVLAVKAQIWESKTRLLNADGMASPELFHLVARWGLRE